jgi:carbon-monoxide dehydrogenase large subunit
VKGVGEIGAIGAPPAVISAVANAIGVRHIEMPATPQKIWRAIQDNAA